MIEPKFFENFGKRTFLYDVKKQAVPRRTHKFSVTTQPLIEIFSKKSISNTLRLSNYKI